MQCRSSRCAGLLGTRDTLVRETSEGRRRMAYTALGESDLAFSYLEEAIRERGGWIAWLGVELAFDPLRGDPRYGHLLEQVGAWTLSSL